MREERVSLIGGLFIALTILLSGPSVGAAPAKAGKGEQSGRSCPHQDVEVVQGSKIVFMEDSYDFGEIPTDRKVTHIFRFRNDGTAPLKIASHVKSKPIQGC